MTAVLRRLAGGGGLMILAIVINIGLFGLAGFLTSTVRPPRDISDPIGVSLVSLAPPEPARQEEVRDPEPPPPETKPDFQPDLVQPSVLGGGVADFAVKIDLGELGNDAGQDNFIFDSVDLDQAPQATVRVPPDYPYGARERGIEGYVAVKFLVREDGTVGNVNVLKAKPEGLFDDAVRRALPKWRFQPGRIGGNPVASWVVTTIRFDLN
ncbi:MAG: energy transducer TonB [Krumholzibacteria bacterium]|nr:energy transducer TonB [Candidatus Krumholzibacteria bacterium]